MNRQTEELVKKLVEFLITRDPGSLICFFISEKQNADMLNNNIKSLISNQSDPDIRNILNGFSDKLAKIIRDLTSNQKLSALKEITDYLNKELQKGEIDNDMIEPVINNLEHYILQYIRDIDPLYGNDLILEKRIADLEIIIAGKLEVSPVIKGNQSLHIDSILDRVMGELLWSSKTF